MNILESIVYGIVSGLSEFLPISSLGHQQLIKIFFGASSPEPLRDIFVHIAFLVAVLISCGTYLDKLRREHKLSNGVRSRRSHHRERRTFYDLAFLKSALLSVVAGMILFGVLFQTSGSLLKIALFFLLSGILIMIPEYMPQGNKDTQKMTGFDSLLFGFMSALSVLPGFSRVGAALSWGIARGADKNKAYQWILVLTVPAVLVLLVFDFIVIFQAGFGVASFVGFLGCLLSGIFAFLSSVAGIYLMRFILVRSGMSAFAFYSWGAAFLSFLLYLSA